MNKYIEIVTYNSNWPELYEVEAHKIKQALGSNLISIHHIGSTSVPNLAAKDKIDIIAEVKNLDFSYNKLENLDYEYRGGFSIPLRKSFTYRSDCLNINLHIFEEDDPEIELNILFRDYLRDNDIARNEYEILKYKILENESSHILRDGAIYRDYTLSKGDFIHNILRQTGFNKLRMVICTHQKEWEAAKSIHNKYFKDKNFIDNGQNYTHLVLYKGVEIIGYAAVKLSQDKTFNLETMLFDESTNVEEYKESFIDLIGKWLELLGYEFIK